MGTGCEPRMEVKNPVYDDFFKSTDTLAPDIGLKMLDSLRDHAFNRYPPGADVRVRYYKERIRFLSNSIGNASVFELLDSLEITLQQNPGLPNYHTYYVDLLSERARYYSERFRYDDAMNLLLSAKQYIDKHFSDICKKSELKMHIADLIGNQEKFVMAAESFVELYRDAQMCDSTSFERFYYSYSGLMNAGYYYIQAGLHDSARYYLQRAMEAIKSAESKFPHKASFFKLARGVVSRHEGINLAAMGDYKQAEFHLKESIERTAKEYPRFSHVATLELTDLYISTRQFNKAQPILQYFDTLSSIPPNSNMKYTVNHRWKKFYQEKGDFEKALYYNDLYQKARDSADMVLKRDRDRDLASEFVANEQTALANQLRLKYQRTSFHLQLASLLAVIALLLVTLIWSNLRKARRYARILKHLNTEIKTQKKDVVDAYKALETSYFENKRLLRTVVHDLKNPITAIGSLVVNISKDVHSKEVKTILNLIKDACNSSINLINTMLESEATQYAIVNKELDDMWRLLQYCVELMKPRADEKKQQLVVEGERVYAIINKDRMWRVITNIINNAVKFSPEKATIHVKLQQTDNKVLLSVRDEGIGIPCEKCELIFSATPDVQREGTAGEKSYGLGLSISKKIIEEHNGRMWVESTIGVGSTFYISLPSVDRPTRNTSFKKTLIFAGSRKQEAVLKS